MNVLQLVPRLNIGGVEKGTVEIARALVLNGHKAVVISAGGPFEKNLAASGARHYTLPVGKKNPFVMIYCYFRIRQIIRDENIDIVHGRSRIPAVTGYIASRRERRTFITTAHGQYKCHLISRVMGWGKVVIVASETMARHMHENFGVAGDKIIIIPRGVDLNRFPFNHPVENKTRPFRIGMICRFTPLKGHLDFLKAASYVSRKIPNLEIILMGDRASARPEYIKKIELAIRHFLIGNIVKFKDPDEGVPEVLGGLDVLVSANREQEAFGRSIIEAQSSGVPVVATRVGGVVENIEDGVTGLLCEAGDPIDMAKAITRLVSDHGLREKIAGNARSYVERSFSLSSMTEATLKTYKEALESKKILVFKISSLGDVILSVPSLRAIRKRFPDSSIKVLVDVKFRKVLEKCPYISEIITCDFKGRDRGRGFLKLASRLRAEDFDISIDLQNNDRSHLLAFLAMIPARYGYNNRGKSFLINHKIDLPCKPIGPLDHQARVLGLLGIIPSEKDLELWMDEESDKWARDFLNANWMHPGQKLVGISLSASRKWKTKNWPLSSFMELTRMLARDRGIRVVLFGVADDLPLADEFMRKVSSKPINAVGKTDIPRLISLIKRCNALVAGDSSPVHIAAAVKVGFVAIFGPTSPERHLPPFKTGKVIKKNVKCSPCYRGTCYKGHRCMTSVRPQEIFDAVMDVIS
ncbi:MAG: lipopolysaccharide heptosyltransferase II [Candidatus Omnitrophica bacterium]|nr:lipopolysaccharide heptosyltransferase II [Candidatus Omnitrophota bacterium]